MTALGPGVMLGIGYPTWIGPQWAAGFLVRATAAALKGEAGSGLGWQQRVVSPTLLLTTTYN